MKGVAILLLSMLTASSMAVFGGGSSDPQSGGTLRFSFFGNLKELDVAKEYVARYQTSHPKVKIELETIGQNDLDTKMVADHIAGSAPDVLRIAHTQVKPWAAKGILLDVGKTISADKLDFTKNALDVFTYKDGVYAFPKTLACRGLLYNKAMFKEAGIPFPTDSWTWEDLMKAAKTLTKKSADGRVIQWGFLLAPQVPGMFGMYLEQAGGQMFSADGTKCAIASPEGLKVLEYWKRLVFTEGVSPTPKVGAGMNYEQGFKLGQIAMIITGPWNRPVYAADCPNLDYGVAEVPKDVARSNNIISDGIGVWSGTKHKALAIDFAKFVAAYEQQKLWWDKLQSHFPATESGLKSILSSGLEKDPLALPFVKGLDYSQSKVWHIKFLEYQPILVSELQAVLNEDIKKDPATALKDAAAKINTILAEK